MSPDASFMKEKYSALFTGLGCMKGIYTLAVSADSASFFATSRRVPLPLIPEVKEELEKKVLNGVIQHITTYQVVCLYGSNP